MTAFSPMDCSPILPCFSGYCMPAGCRLATTPRLKVGSSIITRTRSTRARAFAKDWRRRWNRRSWILGNGFLSHPANETLRHKITAGQPQSLTTITRSLLRLIYRLLFLMVIEERDLVCTRPAMPKPARYLPSVLQSRPATRLAENRYLGDRRRHDLWLALVSTFQLFDANGPGEKLGLKPLAGDLFRGDALSGLETCMLGNDVLLGCLRSLGLYEHPDNGQLIRVNYAALNVEEFGSVYEGLLEYEPHFTVTTAMVILRLPTRGRTLNHRLALHTR